MSTSIAVFLLVETFLEPDLSEDFVTKVWLTQGYLGSTQPWVRPRVDLEVGTPR
jgi:hypothetical protein